MQLEAFMTISTTIEAQEAARALAEFLARFNTMIGIPATLTKAPPVTVGAATAESAHQPIQPHQGVLSEMQTKVLAVLQEAGKPLNQKGLVEAFQSKGWTVKSPEKLGSMLYSCASNLVRKGRLVKTNEGFAIGGQLQLPVTP
jgi:hypothetical protein